VGDSWLHEVACRQKPTFVFLNVTVLYCKPLYSSEAATVGNSGTNSGQILYLYLLPLQTFPIGLLYYDLCIYITVSSCPMGSLCR
jgi:hypothetical protein